MNKKIASKIAIGIILLIAIVVGGVVWLQNNKQAPVTVPVVTQPAPVVQQPAKPITPAPWAQQPTQAENCGDKTMQCPDGSNVNNTGPNCSFQECKKYDLSSLNSELWTKYTNNRLGFSLMIPKYQFSDGADGKKYPVQVSEKGDDIRIYSADTKENDSTWTIKIRKVKSDADINALIKNGTFALGTNCVVDRKDPSLEAGTYDITVKPVGSEDLCGMSMYVLRYYPEKGIAAYWNMGQDNHFIIPLAKPIVDDDGITQSVEGADKIMALSFEFIK
jgi:hypothetical protein